MSALTKNEKDGLKMYFYLFIQTMVNIKK